MRKEPKYYRTPFSKFYFTNSFDISFEICGYFDNRPRINIDLIFFSLEIILPFRNSWTDECDPPKWGIAIHNATLWIYLGGKGNMNGGVKWWTWSFPFINKNWVRTSILLDDDSWAHETPKKREQFYNESWKAIQKSWSYNYTDQYDGSIIPTKIYVEEREWRPKWLGWTSLFAKVSRNIDIHFSEEVGRKKRSWKGGCVGCGYDLLPEEEPLDCLKRMEKERSF